MHKIVIEPPGRFVNGSYNLPGQGKTNYLIQRIIRFIGIPSSRKTRQRKGLPDHGNPQITYSFFQGLL